MEKGMADFDYEVIKNFGAFSESSKGWRKEVNFVSWNKKEPKYDIREWSPDGTKMGKGLRLSKAEIIELRDLLNKIELE